MTAATTLVLVLAGVSGAAGVALAAIAAHGTGDARLTGSAAEIALVHAPALLALAIAPRASLRFAVVAAILIASGVALFSGDLALRVLAGRRLFEGAAPAGGTLLIAGWLLVAVGAASARIAPGKKGNPT